jgi:hypothetical protein
MAGAGSATEQSLAARLPAIVATIVVGAIYLVLPERLTLGPRWLPLVGVVVLLVPLNWARFTGRHHIGRRIALLVSVLLTVVVGASAAFLVVGLPGGGTTAKVLLQDAALIWIANLLVFALWYWEIDCGGPQRRHLEGYVPTDFLFPQNVAGGQLEEGWQPNFLDYVFLAFNTSTAFSPTDTMFLSRRAKALMMLQALMSLIVLAVLAARAINTL